MLVNATILTMPSVARHGTRDFASTSSLTPADQVPRRLAPNPIFSQAFESDVRTIYGAAPNKKAHVFKTMSREAVKHGRAASISNQVIFDRLQEAAVANGLVDECGQDVVQKLIAER